MSKQSGGALELGRARVKEAASCEMGAVYRDRISREKALEVVSRKN